MYRRWFKKENKKKKRSYFLHDHEYLVYKHWKSSILSFLNISFSTSFSPIFPLIDFVVFVSHEPILMKICWCISCAQQLYVQFLLVFTWHHSTQRSVFHFNFSTATLWVIIILWYMTEDLNTRMCSYGTPYDPPINRQLLFSIYLGKFFGDLPSSDNPPWNH